MSTFVGFSTQDAERTRNWTKHDIDLVKTDLANHFHTRVGERVMRPGWGCAIWDYLMEPMTPASRDAIVAEATRVCQEDTRVAVVGVQVVTLDHGLRVDLTLEYKPFAVIDRFSVDFEERNAAAPG